MLALLLAAAVAQLEPVPDFDDGPILSNPATMSRFAFFELAPSNGRGMTAPCACADVTSAKGDAITTVRGTSSFCTKYHPTDNIQVGDLVSCGLNLPRVAAPPGLGLSLMQDWPTTNLVPYAHELGSWLTLSTAGAPTITANQHAGPNNATQADRLQVAACPTAGQASAAYVTITTAANNNAASVYVLGNGASGTLNVCLWDGTAGTCTPCSYVSTGYKRCSVVRNTAASASSAMLIGCNNQAGYTGASNTGAADVFVWAMQTEAGAVPSMPVLSSGAPAARWAGDRMYVTLPANVGQQGSYAVTYTPRHATTFVGSLNGGGPGAFVNSSASARLLYNNLTANVLAYDGTNNPSLGAGYVYLTPKRYCVRWSSAGGWVLKNVTDGTQATSAFATGTFVGGSPVLDFTGAVLGFHSLGYLSNICFSRDTTECCP